MSKFASRKDVAIQAVKKGSRPGIAWIEQYEGYDVSAGFQKYVKRDVSVKEIPTESFKKAKYGFYKIY